MRGLDALGEAEVGDVGDAGGVDQNVGRLQVAVQDTVLVGVLDGAGDGGEVAGGVARAQRAGGQHGGECLRPRHGACVK